MELDRILIIEHLAIDCPLSLKEFCKTMQKHFDLPDFDFDFENETEWGLVEANGIEYNVSRPDKRGTLEEWDETVPSGCNFGISLQVSQEFLGENDFQSKSADLVLYVGQELADIFDREVYHHRTWLGVGNNVRQNQTFYPQQTNLF